MGTSICCRIVVVRLIASSPDRDGAIDLLITTCSSVSRSTGLGTNCALNIAYNAQLPLCASSTSFPYQVILPPQDRVEIPQNYALPTPTSRFLSQARYVLVEPPLHSI
jgi:hypothetical protein